LLRTKCSQPWETIVERVKSTGRWSGELSQTTRDGHEVVVQSRWQAQLDQQGNGEILESNVDITQRKRIELALRQTAEELTRSNRDLDMFASVASHDLQEPLRMVSSYVELFSERYRGKLDERADKYISYALDGVQRMSTLISDLLSYSRVNTRGEPPRKICSQDALEVALKNLHTMIDQSQAEITYDPLPIILADKAQLAQLFQNLVGNAVKYCFPGQRPQVRISVTEDGQWWRFSVSDNGIGFDPKYEERIFLIFQRLHTRDEYPGTGIGLAICKRIVERHGGRIWATSEPGKGSTFCFTVPRETDLSYLSDMPDKASGAGTISFVATRAAFGSPVISARETEFELS
jgi:light-regulated signal transduction histidine kinase (bacteriophytochrome)